MNIYNIVCLTMNDFACSKYIVLAVSMFAVILIKFVIFSIIYSNCANMFFNMLVLEKIQN